MNDFEGVLDDSDCQQLLAVISAMHHHRVNQALHDGTLRFAKALNLVST